MIYKRVLFLPKRIQSKNDLSSSLSPVKACLIIMPHTQQPGVCLINGYAAAMHPPGPMISSVLVTGQQIRP